MSMWLVFWSEHVCKRCDPTLSSERRAEWLGQRRHSHNYTAPSKWFQHFQRVSKLYFQLAAAFVRLVRHHMNALWLSVTSRETKTKCLHRERTVKLGKKKKKEGQTHPVVALHSSGNTSEDRDIIFASFHDGFLLEEETFSSLTPWVWEINSWSQRRRYQTETESNCDVSSAGIRQTHWGSSKTQQWCFL